MYVGISKRLHKDVQIPLVVDDIVLQSCNICFLVSLHLPIGLRVIPGCFAVFDS